jgi:hypothetical protein
MNRLLVPLGKTVATLFALTFILAYVPEALAATTTPSPTPTTRAWNSPSPTPRPAVSTSATPRAGATPTPTPTSNVAQLNPVFADTYVPQIIGFDTAIAYSSDAFTVSFLIKARVHRNTIQSLALELKPKTPQGLLADPIFQTPCTPVQNASVSSITSNGNSTALQKRSKDGDWYLEEYFVESKTKITSNLGPCPGTYLLTGLTLSDSAKHTLNVDANLASTFQATSTSTGSKTPTTPSKSVNTDTAIMQSNIWNSRVDLAPCLAGTNLLPTLTNIVVAGKTVQTLMQPTILSTNRIACAPTIGFNLTNTLFTITDESNIYKSDSYGNQPIFDLTAEIRDYQNQLNKLRIDLESVTAQNAALTEEINKLKTPVVVKPTATPKPTSTAKPKATAKPKVTATPKASAKSTYKPSTQKTPTPRWSGTHSGGGSRWSPSPTPKATAKK